MHNPNVPSASSSRGAKAPIHNARQDMLRHFVERAIIGRREAFALMGLGEPLEFGGRDLAALVASVFEREILDDVGAD